MEPKTIRFIRRGELVSLGNVPPDRTLLDLLREDLGHTGTKEGCGEGDCGACTVVLAEADGDRIAWRAINSCIRLAHSVDGMALYTVEDLQGPDGTLHPAQEAMVQCHGSQCGFCTPGFVMSLFGMYQNHGCARGNAVDRDTARAELSGNLCRCTGYRPILDAAQRMAQLPAVKVDEGQLLAQLRSLTPVRADAPQPVRADAPQPVRADAPQPVRAEPVEAGAGPSTSSGRTGGGGEGYLAPTTLSDLVAARAAHPQAQIVAGCTDVGLWVTKLHKQYAQVLDVTRAAELRQVRREAGTLSIGAAVTLTDAFAALQQDRPQLQPFFERFAGLPVRNSGTLGGNIANGSPIGDSMPLLIALGATIVLASVRGERSIALEDFYTGYRRSLLAPDEVLARVVVPAPAPGEFLRAYKISKRYDDDISAVCLVINLALDGARVAAARIGCGGVAATPVRARKAEAVLVGQAWSGQAADAAARALQAQFQPISDMRASADYRRAVLGNLMRRAWLDSQGERIINLESLRAIAAPEASA